MITILIGTIISAIFQFILFSQYKKVLGLQRLELFKQYLLSNTVNAVFLLVLLILGQFLSQILANYLPNITSVSLTLLILTSVFCISLPLTQLLIYKRLREINFTNKYILIFCLVLELIFKALSPILVLRLI